MVRYILAAKYNPSTSGEGIRILEPLIANLLYDAKPLLLLVNLSPYVIKLNIQLQATRQPLRS